MSIVEGGQTSVAAAVERWRASCLRADGALLGGESRWTVERLARVGAQLAAGAALDTFDGDERALVAELLFVALLFDGSGGPRPRSSTRASGLARGADRGGHAVPAGGGRRAPGARHAP